MYKIEVIQNDISMGTFKSPVIPRVNEIVYYGTAKYYVVSVEYFVRDYKYQSVQINVKP
jgi:hypothetical protein